MKHASGLSLAIIALLLQPATMAQTNVHAQGNLTFATAESVGASDFSASDASVRWRAGGDDAHGQLTLDAANLRVEWWRMKRESIGTAPGSQDEPAYYLKQPLDHGQGSLGSATGTVQVEGGAGAFVVEPRGQVTLLAALTGQLAVSGTVNQTWRTGFDVPITSSDEQVPLDSTEIAAGRLALQARGNTTLELRGTFTMYAWLGNVTIQTPEGLGVYRSGTWYENATLTQTGPRGVARTEYAQLLALHVRDGTLTWTSGEGRLDVVADRASTQTVGSTMLRKARGSLASSEAVFTSEGTDVVMEGTTRLHLSLHAASEEVAALLYTDAELVGDVMRKQTAAAPGVASSAAWVSAAMILAIGATAILGVLVWRRRRLTPAHLEQALDAAERLHSKGRHRRFEQCIRRILHFDPACDDAWHLLALHYSQRGAWNKILQEILPIASYARAFGPDLAYAVARAYAHQDEEDQVRQWLSAAVRSPTLAADACAEPAFAKYQSRAWFSRLMLPNPPFAYA